MKKTIFKTLAIVLSFLMALHAIPAAAFEELANINNSFSETENEQSAVLESDNTSTETKEEHIYEDTSLREANTKHFKLDDGSYMAAQYPYVVHIKDESGSWQDIDNTLADSGSDFSTSNARIKFAKKTTGNESLFTLHDGNYKITMSLNGANKKIDGVVTNNSDAESDTELQKMMSLEKLSSSILYPDILDGIDLEYIVNSLNVKENIIIKEKKDSYSFSFTLKLNNLQAELTENSEISIFDPETSAVIYTIPAPIVYDANNVYADFEVAYYTVTNNGNGKYTLTVTADSEWMNAAERSFPIVLDPAIYTSSSNTVDTYIDSTNAGVSYGTSTLLYAGIYNNGTSEKMTYCQANSLPTIPDNAYISEATIAMYVSGCNVTNSDEMLLGVYPVTNTWYGSTTWNQHLSGVGSLGAIHDCIQVENGKTAYWASWDITGIYRQWANGTLSNNGIAIKRADQGDGYCTLWSSEKLVKKPHFTVNYYIPRGIESYWSFFSHNLPVGTGHINLASGDLTLNIPTLSTTEAIFGFTPSLVYNSGIYNEYNINENNDNVPHIVTSAGYGWQLNVNESVLKKTYIDADGASATYYILTDSDGTEHAFYLDKTTNTYKDEDGLLLTLTENSNYYDIEDSSHTIKSYRKITNNTSSNEGAVLNIITDKFGNKLKVYNYTNGRCNGIAFCPAGGSDVSHMTLSYNAGGCISAITNSTTGHKVTFEYSTSTSGSSSASSGGYLKKMIFSQTSGSTTTNYSIIEFSYRNSGELYIIKDTVTGKSIYYKYSSGKTTIVREKGGSTWGQTIGITYGDGTTTIRSSGEDDKYNNADDIMTHYSFDNKGRAISTYSSNVDGDIIYGASSGQYSDVAENKLNAQITSGQTGVNYLLNGSFNFEESTLTNINDWYKSSSRVSRISYYNDYALQILPKANTTDYVNQFTQLAAGDYTLSLDCETKKCENVSVKMKVISMSTSGESYVKDIPINQNTTNGKISPYLTFNIPSGGAYEIKLEVTGGSSVDANASVIIDNVMLERNIGSTGSNLITFGDFDNNALTAEGNSSFTNFSDYWSFSTNNTSIIALDSNDVIRGTSLSIDGSVGNSYCAYQTIPFPYEDVIYDFIPARFFEVSGFGQGSHQTSSGYFGLAVTITYFDNTTSINYIPFNNEITALQYTSGIIVVPQYSIIKSIKVACIYENNPGTAYFDDISIIQVGNSNAAAYEYYEDTQLLKIEETPENTTFYEYDSSGNLIRQADFHHNYSLYSYTNNALTSEESGTFYGIGEGLLLIEAIEQGAYQTSPIIKTDYTYNAYGLVTRTHTYSPSAPTKIIRTTASYDTVADSKTFGVLLSSTDQNGDTVQYAYDSYTGQLQYQVNADGSSGLYYTYDSIGRLVNVVPLVYYPTTGSYLGENGLEYVDYYYNSLQQLSGISTDTTDYTFAYDEFGNTASISAGNYTLATYIYNSNNGKLASMTYGNGTTVSYTYDALDRIEKILYNDTVRYEYQYTTEGKLHSVTDLASGIGYLYEYDGEDRIVGYVQYNLNNKTNTLGILYTYDEKSRLFEATTTIDYSIGTDTTTQSLLEQYLYNDETNTLSDYMVLFGYYTGNRIEAEFKYDDVQRIDTKKYTLTTSSTLTNTIELTYADRSSGRLLSSFVNTYSTQMGTSTATTYTYTYDDNGNITKIVDNAGKTTKYTYDDLGQLIREDNPYKGACYTYTYDNNGNRTSKSTYAYATGTSGTATSTQTYTYGDATWGDKLTAFNGVSITYDSIGNPLSYYNGTAYTFTWSDGRRLATATKGGVSYSFTYNDEGIRTSKTVGGVKHNYTLEGTRIISEQWGNNLIIYLYDEAGSPIGMLYRTNSYAVDTYDIFYFEKNLQGDIIAIYNAAGTKLVSYTYDAWGNCTTTYYNGGGSTAAQYNPFRYRGYYYDADLGLYYLNSRYYDPNTGRFINTDSYVSTGQGILGYNPFAYCRNEPVFRKDTLGTSDVCIDIFDDNNPLNDLGGNFFGCGSGGAGGASAYYGYDSSAYGTYLTKSATANYDAALGGYSFGGVSSYNIRNYIVPGAVTVTDDMATKGANTAQSTTKPKVTSTIKNDVIDLPRTGSALKTDPYHAFPNIVDNYAGYATKSPISNGILYQLQGSLNGTVGRFEWIIQNQQVTHRMFVPGGGINGIPIMP